MKMFRREIRSDHRAAPAASSEELAVIGRIRGHGQEIHFGAPCRCPDCGSYGFVDRVDLVGGTSQNHCPSCSATWTITQRALLEATSAANRVPAAPVGNGLLIRNLTTLAA